MDSTHIIMNGDPEEGFTFYGPFGSADEAVEWGERHEGMTSWWVVPLIAQD